MKLCPCCGQEKLVTEFYTHSGGGYQTNCKSCQKQNAKEKRLLKPEGPHFDSTFMSIERLHHPWSPSSLQSREACPKYDSSFNTSEAAETGTLQHLAAETREDSPQLTDEKAFAVADVLQFVEGRKALYPGHTFLSEDYLPVSDDILHDDKGNKFVGITGGYIDVAIISEDQKTAELLDHKFGQVAVEKAETNLQGIAYALGLVKKFPTLEKIHVWFLMPHRDEIFGAVFVKDQFPAMQLRVRTVVSRAIEAHKNPEDFSTAVPNQGSCLFCSNLGRCPKVAQIALNVGKKYAPLDIPESISTVIFLDPKEVANGLKLAGIIKTWAEAYRTQATAKSIKSDFIPLGYKLVSTTKRKLVNPRQFGDIAKTFLPPEDWEKVEQLYDIPIGKVEKLISIVSPRGTKEAKVEEFGAAALAAGALEMGAPFAFLRQDNAKE